MRSYIYLPFVLLLGLVVGGWGVRSDLREARAELKEVRQQARKGGGTGRAVQIGQGVTSLLNIDQRPASEGGKNQAGPGKPETSGDEPEAGNPSIKKPERPRRQPRTPEERKKMFEDNINRATEMWELRAQIAKATFVDRTGLNEEQAERFDVLVDAMNVRLANEVEGWVSEIEGKENIGPEDGVRLVNSVTEVMVSAYDDIDRDMPENWRDKNDGELNVTDFIDPGVAMPLVRVQDRMGNGAMGGGARNRGDLIF